MAGIYRRGRTWWARAQRSGREHRESLKTPDRRVAERRYRDWLERLDAIAWGDRPRRTFAEAVERFLTEHCATIKPSSARRYAVSLKQLAETFTPLHLDQITRETLSDYESLRRATPSVEEERDSLGRRRRPRVPSASTIRRDLACLSSLLTSCEDWNWIEEGSNPVPGFLKRRAKRGLKEAPPRTRYLSEAEEAALLAKASPAVRGAIMVAIDTGLRREEQFSLTWPQIDFKRGVIMTTKRTKNGRARPVPLPERSAQVLGALTRQRFVGKVRTLHVFRHEDGMRLVNMDKGLKGAMARANIKDLRWHDLRRTAGCRWLQREKRSMEEVSILLGHSSVVVTERSYAFLEGEAIAASVAQSPAQWTAEKPAKLSVL